MIQFDTNKNTFIGPDGHPLSREALGAYSEDYLERIEEASRTLALYSESIGDEGLGIYVADLAQYVAGKLRGRWFDLSEFRDAEDLEEALKAFIFLGGPDSEEWAIHDYDAPVGSIASHFGEYPDLSELMACQTCIAEHGADWTEAAIACGVAFGYIEDEMYGSYEDEEDLGQQMAEAFDADSLGTLANYIDYERFGRDLLNDFNHTEVNGRLYLFSY